MEDIEEPFVSVEGRVDETELGESVVGVWFGILADV